MTQLQALEIAYEELSNMMPYDGENDEIFEAAETIIKMIHTRKRAEHRKQLRAEPRSRADRKRHAEIMKMFDDVLKDL